MWDIVEVARMSGVTARMLRHYDEVGLLRPARMGGNGHRQYGEDELLRLQQILLMGELGVGLREVAAVLDRDADRVEVLRAHHRRLLAERTRIDTLARTVGRTLAELEDGRRSGAMTRISRPENLFEGFDHERYAPEARERWPVEAGQAQRYAETLTPEDTARMQAETTASMVRMAEFMVAGTPVEAPEVQEEVDGQYAFVSRFWTPSAAAFESLGRTYTDDPQWRAVYEGIAEGLAEYQRDAMAAYARARL